MRHQKLVHRSNSSRRSTHRLRTGRKAPRIQYRTEVWPPGPPFKRRDRVPPIAARCCKARLHSVFLAASVARAEVSEFEFIWSQLEPNPREEGSKIVGRKVPRSHLNRRYQPFQGWLLPELSADSAKLSSENLPNFVLLIGAKMEPSCENLSLPRFASISVMSEKCTFQTLPQFRQASLKDEGCITIPAIRNCFPRFPISGNHKIPAKAFPKACGTISFRKRIA